MKIKIFLICMLSMSLFGNCSNHSGPKHCMLIEEIMKNFVNEVERDYKLVCSGSGGKFMDRVNVVNLYFYTMGPKSTEELRELMVVSVNKFLDQVNVDQNIRQYLVQYPFQAQNLCFAIYLRGTDLMPISNEGSNEELLYGVQLVNGKLFYLIKYDTESTIQNLHIETYTEAVEIVLRRNNNK